MYRINTECMNTSKSKVTNGIKASLLPCWLRPKPAACFVACFIYEGPHQSVIKPVNQSINSAPLLEARGQKLNY